MISEEERRHIQQRAALEGAVHAASDALHQVTGRTDQTLHDIMAENPDHPAAVAWCRAVDDLAAFLREGQNR